MPGTTSTCNNCLIEHCENVERQFNTNKFLSAYNNFRQPLYEAIYSMIV